MAFFFFFNIIQGLNLHNKSYFVIWQLMSMLTCWSIKIQVMDSICVRCPFLERPLSIVPNSRTGKIGANMRSTNLKNHIQNVKENWLTHRISFAKLPRFSFSSGISGTRLLECYKVSRAKGCNFSECPHNVNHNEKYPVSELTVITITHNLSFDS